MFAQGKVKVIILMKFIEKISNASCFILFILALSKPFSYCDAVTKAFPLQKYVLIVLVNFEF